MLNILFNEKLYEPHDKGINFVLYHNKSATAETGTYFKKTYFIRCQSPVPTAPCIRLWILIVGFH